MVAARGGGVHQALECRALPWSPSDSLVLRVLVTTVVHKQASPFPPRRRLVGDVDGGDRAYYERRLMFSLLEMLIALR